MIETTDKARIASREAGLETGPCVMGHLSLENKKGRKFIVAATRVHRNVTHSEAKTTLPDL